MNPKASFVIPAYNAEAYLRETLDSCLDQSVKQIEVIVVNDASSDGTKDLLDFYQKKDERIKPIHLTQNGGSAKARNIGNKAAAGDYILVLDGDDKAIQTRVKETIKCFEKDHADLIYGAFIQIDTFNNMEKHLVPPPFNKEMSLKHSTHFIGHSTVAYRKGVSLNVQYVEDHAKLAMEDFSFIWNAFTKGYKFSYTLKPLSYIRRTDGSQSTTRNETDVKRAKNEFVSTLKI